MSKDAENRPNVKVRQATKDKIAHIAESNRIDQMDVVEVAVEAFESLPATKQVAFIRKPKAREQVPA